MNFSTLWGPSFERSSHALWCFFPAEVKSRGYSACIRHRPWMELLDNNQVKVERICCVSCVSQIDKNYLIVVRLLSHKQFDAQHNSPHHFMTLCYSALNYNVLHYFAVQCSAVQWTKLHYTSLYFYTALPMAQSREMIRDVALVGIFNWNRNH